MNTVRKLSQSDETGTIHVDVPIGAPHRQVEILVVWHEVDDARTAREAQEKKRAELEALAGALADDPIVRPDQPVLETRLPVE